MSRHRLLNAGTLLPLVAAILLVVAVACGSSATATPAPTTAAAATSTPAAVAGPTATTARQLTPVMTAAPAPTEAAAVPVPSAQTMLKAPEPNPKRGGILQWAGLSDSPHFDMHQCNTAACAMPQGPFFDNLVRYSPFDGGVEIIPDLAVSWDISDDGLIYTFHLRDGVKFHDGALLTSEDIEATFDRIIFPPTGMLSPRQSIFEAVTDVRIVDPLTVEFVLSAPRSFLPAAIASG